MWRLLVVAVFKKKNLVLCRYRFFPLSYHFMESFLLFSAVTQHKLLLDALLNLLVFLDTGGGHPDGGQHHCPGDVSAPPAGLALHPVLHVQALQQEKEEEEERPQHSRPLINIAVSAPMCLNQENSTSLTKKGQSAGRTFFFFSSKDCGPFSGLP